MSGILRELGLDRETVRRLAGAVTRDAEPRTRNAERVYPIYHCVEDAKYLLGPSQKRIRIRLKLHESWMVGRFLYGDHPSVIAMYLGVSEESVRKRLRSRDLFASRGKAGRPKKSKRVKQTL